MSAKLAKKLPKRVGNTKAKALRERSANAAKRKKEQLVGDQNVRRGVNVRRQYTGKQLDDAMRLVHGAEYRTFKRDAQQEPLSGEEALVLLTKAAAIKDQRRAKYLASVKANVKPTGDVSKDIGDLAKALSRNGK